MSGLREKLNRRMTPRQTAGILTGVIVLLILGYLAYLHLEPYRLDRRARALMPQIETGIRDQRQDLVQAIEAYKAHFGVYPPDHVLSRQPMVVDAVTNPLMYELGGVIYNSSNRMFELGRMEPAEAAFVTNVFNFQGFKNSGTNAAGVKHFVELERFMFCLVHDDPDIYVVRYNPTVGEDDFEALSRIEISPWRYISSAPTHNPGKFDLWTELRVGERKTVIGNWASSDSSGP